MLSSPSVERTKISARIMAGRAFLVKTPACVNYFKQMNNWLMTGAQGALVYGRPRLGKTSATRWVLNMLPEVLGSFPTVEIPVRGQNIATEKPFFQHLLRCVKHKHAMLGTTGDKRDRFSEWLIGRAIRSPMNGAVLFFDEAQLLHDEHYNWLLNIGNELDRSGCRLFCLLVGQPELMDIKPKFINDNKEQIVGRFMVRELEFKGIMSEQELINALYEYHETQYPSGSGKLFASNFIPNAVASGFRLEMLGPAMWSSFKNRWLKAQIGEEISIPMHYFTSTLLGIMNALFGLDRKNLQVPNEIIEKSVSASGYIQSLQILSISKQRFPQG